MSNIINREKQESNSRFPTDVHLKITFFSASGAEGWERFATLQ